MVVVQTPWRGAAQRVLKDNRLRGGMRPKTNLPITVIGLFNRSEQLLTVHQNSTEKLPSCRVAVHNRNNWSAERTTQNSELPGQILLRSLSLLVLLIAFSF